MNMTLAGTSEILSEFLSCCIIYNRELESELDIVANNVIKDSNESFVYILNENTINTTREIDGSGIVSGDFSTNEDLLSGFNLLIEENN